MRIEVLKSDQIEPCAELYVKVLNGAPWFDKWSHETAFHRLNNIFKTPHFIGVVAFEDEQVVGAILGNREQWYEGYHYALKEMFVLHQKRGIGTQMMQALEVILKEQGVHSIELFTSKGDKIDEFYAKQDFRILNDMCMMYKNVK
jgi:aminoglycoside 6'-N-acetyltransferase I